jgi:hypothetical protein
MDNNNFDFLESFILQILEQNGIKDLTDEQKKKYVPEFLSRIYQRLGAVLIPKLSDDNLKTFSQLMENKNTKPEDWQRFWASAIPNFDGEVTGVLSQFSKDLKDIFSKVK